MRIKNFILRLFIFIQALVPFTYQSQVHAKEWTPAVETRLNQFLNSTPDLQGAIAGISIRSATDGTILYQHQGDIRLRPASNLKLLTAAAALDVLGMNYTFPTEIYADGQVKKKTLNGNLYIKGKGDPTLMKKDFDKMASKLKKMGIKRIQGDLIGDDSWYDNIRYSKDLPWSDETTYYGAQISALTASPTKDFDAGSVLVEVKPGTKIGDKPSVTVTPETNYVKLLNHSKTAKSESKRKIKIEREHAKNTIVIEGTFPMKTKPVKEWVGVWEPTRFAVTLFNQSLTKHGIKVSGKIKTGMVPDTANILISHQSMPLAELMIPFMKLSNNVHAEMLVKEMGKVVKGEGSWNKGLEVMEAELAKWGVNPKTMVLRDGSGVSHVNLISANQISQLLFSIQKEKWFPSYLRALPIAGEEDKLVGGTLQYRLKNPNLKGKVRAKTGTLSTVSSLSGYVTTKSGSQLVFSIMLNNLLDDEKGKKIEDQIVQLLVMNI
ncbi:D-alanyl-D-alanine carboxypeptidase/D-alanyl-D-alanine endopeptidase [Neobacillus fumarioli]|uniref:D-alanyl-D-alanine carboxypeptidase/D-alanyl-D-alanine endopeptidase n=1 Tax=Neobacillus fumarioli TaxID=105229 RepID=UPI0008300B82|nr:D-alanyl-D-alanine carboxypeptidase/D-alanyl-D-alanine-endopeptidase [Neobacillus fumarioli]